LAEASESTGATTGVQPSGFAAACLYEAGREQDRWLTQSDVAEAANVSPVTVRTHWDALNELAV
jgi:transcription initiation factor TFIIB